MLVLMPLVNVLIYYAAERYAMSRYKQALISARLRTSMNAKKRKTS
jgi:hypothetical protein